MLLLLRRRCFLLFLANVVAGLVVSAAAVTDLSYHAFGTNTGNVVARAAVTANVFLDGGEKGLLLAAHKVFCQLVGIRDMVYNARRRQRRRGRHRGLLHDRASCRRRR